MRPERFSKQANIVRLEESTAYRKTKLSEELFFFKNAIGSFFICDVLKLKKMLHMLQCGVEIRPKDINISDQD
jgi:hypothetical protein